MPLSVDGRAMALGIDVSGYQPVVDWNQVAAVRQFAYLKASGGDGGLYTDGTFATKAFASKGRLPRGAYHFLGPGDGAAQARHFVQTTNGYTDLELPPVVDYEAYGYPNPVRPPKEVLRAFIDELHARITRRWPGPTGEPVAVVVYSGAPMADLLRACQELARYDLWLAAYMSPQNQGQQHPPATPMTSGANPAVDRMALPNQYTPLPWLRWSAWQFAGNDGRCPGVRDTAGNDAECDQNVASVEWLQRVLGGAYEQEDDVSYSKWSSEEQWAEAVGVTNLVTGESIGPPYEGKRPRPENTIAGIQDRLAKHIIQQTKVNQAILRKLGIDFTMDQGAIVIEDD